MDSSPIAKENYLLTSPTILPIKEIKPDVNNVYFSYNFGELPPIVSILLKTNRLTSTNRGRVNLLGENLFWISSQLKLILFNPVDIKNAIEINVHNTVVSVFADKSYLIISHPSSFITIVYFPQSLSKMRNKNILESRNFKTDSVPYSFFIVSATENFVGCSDGSIRSFYLSGHWPNTHFLFHTKASTSRKDILKADKCPIIYLAQTDKYLYALNSKFTLAVYSISNTTIRSHSQPIKTIEFIDSITNGKLGGIEQFGNSLALTKSIGGKLLFTSVLTPDISFHAKHNGAIVANFSDDDLILEGLCQDGMISPGESIYHIHQQTTKDRITKRVLVPTRFLKGYKIVTVFFKYDTPVASDIFLCKVSSDDVIIFAYDNLLPTPYAPLEDQLIPMSHHSEQGTILGHELISINIDQRPAQHDTQYSNSESRLRVVQEYSLCGSEPNYQEMTHFRYKQVDTPHDGHIKTWNGDYYNNNQTNERNDIMSMIKTFFSKQPIQHQQQVASYYSFDNVTPKAGVSTSKSNGKGIEELYGFDSIKGATFGEFKSIFCFFNTSGSQNEFATVQLGSNPVVRIKSNPLGAASVFASAKVVTKRPIKERQFDVIQENRIDQKEQIIFFTSTGLLSISLSEQEASTTLNNVQILKDLLPFYMKSMTKSNLESFLKHFDGKLTTTILPLKNFFKQMDPIKKDIFYIDGSDDQILPILTDLHFIDLFTQPKYVEDQLKKVLDILDQLKISQEQHDEESEKENMKNLSRLSSSVSSPFLTRRISHDNFHQTEHQEKVQFRNRYLKSINNSTRFSTFIESNFSTVSEEKDDSQIKFNTVLIWSAEDFNKKMDDDEFDFDEMNSFFNARFHMLESASNILPFD